MSKLETFVDWFAGIGGFKLGLERLGLRCVGSCENDKWCRQIYRKNFGNEPEFENAEDVDPREVPDHDLFCAGFPCQSFSVAGRRLGFQDTRGTLFFEICRVLDVKRPTYLLLENVKGLLTAPYVDEGGEAIPGTNGWVFYKVLESLGELGYNLQWQVLNSRYYGAPQSRERIYLVGSAGGVPQPEVFPLTRDAEEVEESSGWRLNPIGKLHRHQGGRVYGPGSIAPTLDTGRGPLIDTGGGIRLVTPVERERLQGFPDGWTEGVSNAQRYRQTGNAVSVTMTETIGRRLLEEVNKEVNNGSKERR